MAKRRKFFSILLITIIISVAVGLYIESSAGKDDNNTYADSENVQETTMKASDESEAIKDDAGMDGDKDNSIEKNTDIEPEPTAKDKNSVDSDTGVDQRPDTSDVEKKDKNVDKNTDKSTDKSTDKNTEQVKDNENKSQSSVEVSDNTDSLQNKLKSYIKKYQGTYGIYFMSLVDETEFGINDTGVYIAASTVKIPINLYLFEKIREGNIDPESTLIYQESDYEGGTGKIQYQKKGSKYKIRELSMLSIAFSDNVATNMLLRLLERPNVKNYMRELGGTVVDDEKNVSCPRDMALYMKKVDDFCKENSVLGKELMGYFENTAFNDRIPKLLPKNVKVAHKIGNQVRALHDVGIVYGSKPYILSVMSKNINETEAKDVIANISKIIYDHIENTN